MPTLTLDNQATFYFEYRVSLKCFPPLLLALMDALGIDVRAVTAEWATYVDMLEECNAIGGGGAALPDAE
jgi:hypothetical protein